MKTYKIIFRLHKSPLNSQETYTATVEANNKEQAKRAFRMDTQVSKNKVILSIEEDFSKENAEFERARRTEHPEGHKCSDPECGG